MSERPAAKILTSEQVSIDAAADILRRGGLVAFPTETVYGLGAHALDARAVARIFEAKDRPRFDPLIVHVLRFRRLTRSLCTTEGRRSG